MNKIIQKRIPIDEIKALEVSNVVGLFLICIGTIGSIKIIPTVLELTNVIDPGILIAAGAFLLIFNYAYKTVMWESKWVK